MLRIPDLRAGWRKGLEVWRDLRSAEPPQGPSTEDAGFMPDRLAVLFQQPPRRYFLIVRGSLAFLVLGLVWAALADLDEITVAEGKVIPSSRIQVIQNLEGGIVAKIPVNVGDLVKKGQIVMNLDETRFSSSVGEAKAKYQALHAKIARLTAEATDKPFDPPKDLVAANPGIVADEQALYQSRQRELEANLTILRQQANQRSQELSEKRSRFQQLTESHRLVAQELKMSKPLAQQGVISEVEILRLERQVNDIYGEMEATRLAIPRLESAIAEANGKIAGTLAKFRADAASDLAQAQAEFAGTSASSVAMEDRLARTAVRSPVNGIIKQIKVTTVGGVIQPGMDVMEIVPLEPNLLIEARIRPSDIGFVAVGQPAMVKLSAYDFSIYGGLDAVVENITADTITSGDKDRPESFYQVRVRTRNNHLGTADKPLPIIPGMTATVHIRTGKKSVLAYLLKPVIKAKQEALRER